MEFIILGLLMARERTLYELNKVLKTNITLFYSASFGSISSALGKLEAKQWVVLWETVERGRNKKVFAITAAGQEAFRAWLASPIPGEKVREPALARLFFFGYLPPQARIAAVEQHLASLETLAATLTLLEQQNTDVPLPAAHQDLAVFQQLTLRYGKDYYAFSIAWYRRLLDDLKGRRPGLILNPPGSPSYRSEATACLTMWSARREQG
ncbi:PadR family transcriptional regulator [Candidatus Gracilibacteria bacterium]|nr:PadR family transcriptional regulator [Candidatus Gracilibacteria bacterium]